VARHADDRLRRRRRERRVRDRPDWHDTRHQSVGRDLLAKPDERQQGTRREGEAAIAARALSQQDKNVIADIVRQFDRSAFTERLPAHEDLRAMFSAFNGFRVFLQQNRKGIANDVVRPLLESLDDEFRKIGELSPWGDQETDVRANPQRLHENYTALYAWRSTHPSVAAALKPLDPRNGPEPLQTTSSFLETVRARQAPISAVIDTIQRMRLRSIP
jgi:hypothetical protein